MTKLEFLTQLESGLDVLTESDAQERLNFYSEMIDDRIDSGLSEEEATAGLGTTDEISEKIKAELLRENNEGAEPAAAEKKESRKISKTVSLVLGALPAILLAITVFALGITVYAVAWSAIACLFAANVAMAACAVAGAVMFFVNIFRGALAAAMIMLGTGALLSGLSILFFFGNLKVTEYMIKLTKNLFLGIVNKIKKEVKKYD